MGWIYSVSCEAMWCLSPLKEKKKTTVILADFNLALGRSQQLQVSGVVVRFKDKVTSQGKTQGLLFVGSPMVYTESNTGSLYFQHRRHVMSDCFAYVKNKRFEEEILGFEVSNDLNIYGGNIKLLFILT